MMTCWNGRHCFVLEAVLITRSLQSGVGQWQHNVIRSTMGKAQGTVGALRSGCSSTTGRWEMGDTPGLGREAENLLRDLFLQLGSTLVLKTLGASLPLKGQQPR